MNYMEGESKYIGEIIEHKIKKTNGEIQYKRYHRVQPLNPFSCTCSMMYKGINLETQK